MSRPEIARNPAKSAPVIKDRRGGLGGSLDGFGSISKGCLWYVSGRSIVGLGRPRADLRRTLGKARADLRRTLGKARANLRISLGLAYDLSSAPLQSQVPSGTWENSLPRKKENENG